MTATMWAMAFLLGVLVVVGGVLWWRILKDAQDATVAWDRVAHLQQVYERVREAVQGHTRYQITVTDWGEDFTGEDGTLHRYRWVVSDADQPLRKVLDLEPEYTPNYLMLGNEPERELAWARAFAWVEQQQHPIRVVMGSDQ